MHFSSKLQVLKRSVLRSINLKHTLHIHEIKLNIYKLVNQNKVLLLVNETTYVEFAHFLLFSFQPRYSDPLQANSEICKFVRIKEIFSHKDRWLLHHIILRQSYVGVKKQLIFFSAKWQYCITVHICLKNNWFYVRQRANTLKVAPYLT